MQPTELQHQHPARVDATKPAAKKGRSISSRNSSGRCANNVCKTMSWDNPDDYGDLHQL